MLDFSILTGITAISWKIVSPISKQGALAGTALFIGLYLYTGSSASLHRDSLVMLPFGVCFVIVTQNQISPLSRFIIIGMLCGFSCGFKPNYIITIPLFFVLLCRELHRLTLKQKIQYFVLMGTSFTAVFCIPFLWGSFKGDYQALIHIYKTFTPIYIESRGDLYHYANSHEHFMDLFKNHATHTINLLIFSFPGLLWSWI